jgi:beta-lactamase regulating signal transducer with metallopeptidase domain
MDAVLDLGLHNAMLALLLALLVAALCCLFRRPAIRHGLWLLVLLKLLTPPLCELRIPWHVDRGLPGVEAAGLNLPRTLPEPLAEYSVESPSLVPTDIQPLGEETIEPAPSLLPNPNARMPAIAPPSTATDESPRGTGFHLEWKPLVLALWLAGSVLWFGLAGCRLWRFRQFVGMAGKDSEEVQQEVDRLAVLLGVHRPPRVLLAAGAVAPMLFGFVGRPTLLLPVELWDRLDARQRETLLAHELAHVRRGDPRVRWLEFLVLGLYFWHPVAWWARRRLRDAEEEACDAWVVAALPSAREAYAHTLIEAVSFLSRRRPALPLIASGVAHVHFMQRRLTMIMRGNPRARLTWLGVAAILAVASLLPFHPTWAQSAPTPPASSTQPERAVTEPVKVRQNTPAPSANISNAPSTTSPYGPASVQELSDEVDVLRAQLDAKRAEMAEAKALVEQSRRLTERLNKLRGSGSVATEEVDQAQTELQVREARLLAKEAHVREAELRLRQAERRLASQRASGSTGSSTGGSSEKSAIPMVPPSTAKTASTAPAANWGIRSDFARPEIPLGTSSAAQLTPEQRMRDLEKKLEALSKELEALRRQMSGQSGPAR